jgi:cell wall-associated NlpC family hydrolase
MRIAAPAFGPLARCAWMALILALHAGTAAAAPEETFDPLLRLLADKGRRDTAAAAEGAAAEPGLLRKVQDRASDMVVAALSFVGVPYQRGGASAEAGFDCSGFTRHVFETSLGLVLPRKVDEQATAPGLVEIRREELRPGDLVFFNTLKRTFSHVGIYIGDNRFIHAPRSGKLIRTDSMSFAYWADRFTGARRVVATPGPQGQTPAQPQPQPQPQPRSVAAVVDAGPTAP